MTDIRWMIACSAALMLAACVASGVRVTEEQVSELEKGRTTYNEVLAKFGPPTSNTLISNGTRVISYSYVQVQARAESFIPYIGPFVGGSDAKTNIVSLTFAPDGVLQNFVSSSSQRGTGFGAASGAPAERVESQPRRTP